MLKIVEITKQSEWDEFILQNNGHPLQLWGWGELKNTYNWEVKRLFIKRIAKDGPKRRKTPYSDVVAAAQVLIRPLPWPLNSFAYIPRGPLVVSDKPAERAKMLYELTSYFKSQKRSKRPVCLSVEPEWELFPGDENSPIPVSLKRELKTFKHWRQARNQILIPETLIIDLEQSDDELLSKMSKKTRQYIRKSSNDISVRQLTSQKDLQKCLEIYKQTADRAKFKLHDDDYYLKMIELMPDNSLVYGAFAAADEPEAEDEVFAEVEKSELLEVVAKETDDDDGQAPSENQAIISQAFGDKLAKKEELVAFLWLVNSNKTAFELYGGVNQKGQELRANYILKWLTIKQVQSQGVTSYDMNGLLNDGVSAFKRGFASHDNRLSGTYDYPIRKSYIIWSLFLPLGKKIFRLFRRG